MTHGEQFNTQVFDVEPHPQIEVGKSVAITGLGLIGVNVIASTVLAISGNESSAAIQVPIGPDYDVTHYSNVVHHPGQQQTSDRIKITTEALPTQNLVFEATEYMPDATSFKIAPTPATLTTIDQKYVKQLVSDVKQAKADGWKLKRVSESATSSDEDRTAEDGGIGTPNNDLVSGKQKNSGLAVDYLRVGQKSLENALAEQQVSIEEAPERSMVATEDVLASNQQQTIAEMAERNGLSTRQLIDTYKKHPSKLSDADQNTLFEYLNKNRQYTVKIELEKTLSKETVTSRCVNETTDNITATVTNHHHEGEKLPILPAPFLWVKGLWKRRRWMKDRKLAAAAASADKENLSETGRATRPSWAKSPSELRAERAKAAKQGAAKKSTIETVTTAVARPQPMERIPTSTPYLKAQGSYHVRLDGKAPRYTSSEPIPELSPRQSQVSPERIARRNRISRFLQRIVVGGLVVGVGTTIWARASTGESEPKETPRSAISDPNCDTHDITSINGDVVDIEQTHFPGALSTKTEIVNK